LVSPFDVWKGFQIQNPGLTIYYLWCFFYLSTFVGDPIFI